MTVSKQQRLEAEIARGDHDPYLLSGLGAAIEARVREINGPSAKWQVTYNGQTVSAHTVTLGEARFIEACTRVPYVGFNPILLDGHKMAAVAVLLARGGMERDEAWAKSDEVPTVESEASEYLAGDDPLAAA